MNWRKIGRERKRQRWMVIVAASQDNISWLDGTETLQMGLMCPRAPMTGFSCILESTWKYLNFFLIKSRPWKYLKTGQMLESPWIHQVKLHDGSNFVKQVFCLKEDLLIIVLFCFINQNCPMITEVDIKYWCNTVHAVNFRQELVLENTTSGSLKVLEKSLNFSTKI